MLQAKLSPSMMCADLFRLEETLAVFEKTGVEYLHIDIMDGGFVPNFTLGTDFCKQLKRRTEIPLDVHLMIDEPERKLGWFPVGPGDIVSVHAESTKHLHKALAAIRETGAQAFAAVNPGTPFSVLEPVSDALDGVLVMTVNPGFAGQKMIPSTLKKITEARRYLDANGFERVIVEVDGNVSLPNAAAMRAAGADLFVAGTAGLFRPDLPLADGVRALRAAISGAGSDTAGSTP